jgi:SAM-dependent methyltransferase|tara:strand:+ start:3237 stop:4505 length:1269 start_codon:yes stop_codon:yes gene_type:complete
MAIFYKIKKCRICKNKDLKKIIDLNNQYIQGSFIKKNFPKPYLKKIPLQLALCTKCSLVQLLHTTKKEILYKNYWYESGINKTMKIHLKNLVNLIFKIKKREVKNIRVLDIGCNDGTLLKCYPKNVEKYGIDPSQIINKIDKKKVNVIRDFFPPQKKKFKNLKIKFDLITSIAMFYDLQDPNSFVKNIKYNLKDKEIWVFELSYLLDMLKLNSFDTICHEHLEYYSLHSLNYLMKNNRLKIFHISKNLINGGSIRCFVTHDKNDYYDDKYNLNVLKKMINNEKKLKINSLSIYKKFFIKILKLKKKLNIIIKKIKNQNKSIYILGASTKGNTILQFLEIDNKILPYAVERNKEKIGAKTIGSNIKIISEKSAKKNPPNYQLVLPWHFKNEIIKRELNYLKKGGNLIFPLPKIKIINKRNLNL